VFPRRHGYVRGESAGLGYKSLDLGPEAKVYLVIPEVTSVVCAVGAYDKRDPVFFRVKQYELLLALCEAALQLVLPRVPSTSRV
jgi:hypothetical protein